MQCTMEGTLSELQPTQVAGCALLSPRYRLYLLHRIEQDWWELPGGKVDTGEEAETAAVRETHEELNVTVRSTGKLGSSPFVQNGKPYEYSWFGAELIEGDPIVNEPHIHDALNDYSKDELEAMFDRLSPNAQNLVKKIIDGEIELWV